MLEMEASTNAVASSSKLPKTKSKHKHGDKHSKHNGHNHKHDKGVSGSKDIEGSKKKKKEKSEKGAPYEVKTMRMRLSIPPRYSADYMGGVREQLDAMVMR